MTASVSDRFCMFLLIDRIWRLEVTSYIVIPIPQQDGFCIVFQDLEEVTSYIVIPTPQQDGFCIVFQDLEEVTSYIINLTQQQDGFCIVFQVLLD